MFYNAYGYEIGFLRIDELKLKQMNIKNTITEHYRKFFDLHAKRIALDEDDHLNIDWAEDLVKNCFIADVVESAELEANDEQGTPIVDEDGSMTCNCVEPKQSSFPNGKWICLKCWGEWYH